MCFIVMVYKKKIISIYKHIKSELIPCNKKTALEGGLN